MVAWELQLECLWERRWEPQWEAHWENQLAAQLVVRFAVLLVAWLEVQSAGSRRSYWFLLLCNEGRGL